MTPSNFEWMPLSYMASTLLHVETLLIIRGKVLKAGWYGQTYWKRQAGIEE